MQHWKEFDPETRVKLGAVQKTGKTCVAPLAEPLLLQSPPFATTALVDEHGDPMPCIYARPPEEFLDKLRKTEEELRELCVAAKGDWLKRAATDDELRQSFKSFIRDGAIKVSVPEDCAFFDADKNGCERGDVGSHARAIMELTRVVFGKTEFGAIWRAVQIQAAPDPAPKCLIVSDDEDAAPCHDDDNDDDLREFE